MSKDGTRIENETAPPLTGIEIDFMQESDLRVVMEIERQSFSCPWSEAAFRQEMNWDNPCSHVLVARHNQAPVAFIIFWIVEDEVHIANFAVSPACRRQGVGTYLLVKSLEYIRERGGRKIFLEVRVSNIPAQNLYRKFGFKIVSIRKRYYTDNGEDAYVFCIPDLRNVQISRWLANEPVEDS